MVTLPLRRRLGIVLNDRQITAVLMHPKNDTIDWWRTAPLEQDTDDTVATTLATVLESLPRASHLTIPPRVTIFLGSQYARWKTVRNLPATRDRRVLEQIVATAPHRFFLGEPGGLVTTSAQVIELGVIDAGAVPRTMVEQLSQALYTRGIAVAAVTPLASVLDLTLPRPASNGVPSSVSVTLQALSAITPQTPVYRTSPQRDPNRTRTMVRWIGAVIALSIVVALLLPAVLAWQTSTTARQTIAQLASVRAEVQNEARDVAELVGVLEETAAFTATRLSHTQLLAVLNEAMPAGAAITMLRTDSSGILLTVLAPRAADIITRLEAVPMVRNVAVVGPVTPEATAAEILERLTVRFQYRQSQDALIPLDMMTHESTEASL